ncbi:MAG TPA: DUF1992 domain-containing protein [Jatrophihabitans sp.]
MTTRKPPRMSFPDWVEGQIRAAEDQGAFDHLPGKGKPIPGLGRPRDDMTWIAGKLRAEHVDIGDVLPPALALAREVERLPQRLRQVSSEAHVREIVTDLNARIRRAHLAPQVGPPMRVSRVDVDDAVAQWRAARPVPKPRPAAAPDPRRRRGWFTRRRPNT